MGQMKKEDEKERSGGLRRRGRGVGCSKGMLG